MFSISIQRLEEQGLLEYLNPDVTTRIKEYIAMGGISELLEVGKEKGVGNAFKINVKEKAIFFALCQQSTK